jgi:uncharacterized protein (TIGR00251 family)
LQKSAKSADSIVCEFKVVTGASETGFAGWHGTAIKVRLKSPPVDGRANAELTTFLAARLGISRSEVTIVHGLTSRIKRVAFNGVTQEQLAAILPRSE